jgi:transposase-like protein
MAPSLVEQIFQPRNREELRARLAAHRRRWKKKTGHSLKTF